MTQFRDASLHVLKVELVDNAVIVKIIGLEFMDDSELVRIGTISE